ncbi:META domain-containing protein [Cellulomonas massiliensis]|uniref:META domain-containing protein n=1 Tax=Cellulomonas massiliensis TaxID=1465811 RepID=UPI000300EE4C|nr:META domain-containing protein [Cellulomonas massiliensis]
MQRLIGEWRVAGLDGTDATPEDLEQADAWLRFDGDGQLVGKAGVNRVRGTWTLEGDTLTFGPVVSTMMAGPPGPTAVEQAVTALLAGPLVLRTEDDGAPLGALELVAGGATLTLRRDPAAGADLA